MGTHASEMEQTEENGEKKFDENFCDHNEHSESDSGIQQHYESMDFTSQNMYQDEAGYSYYYEDVHYDEEDDSDSDEELDEYSHVGNQVQHIHPYSSYNEYANDEPEAIYNSQEPNDISSQGFDQEIEGEISCQLTQEEIEGLQNHAAANVEECENDNYSMNLKSEQSSLRVSDESPLEQNSEDTETNLRQNDNSDTYIDRNTVEENTEETNDSQSSNQHRKTIESIATEDVEEIVQNENKQAKTLMGNHNSKNRRRKKLRKT